MKINSNSELLGRKYERRHRTTVATVSNGLVTGAAQGSAIVTVTYEGQTVSVPVTVTMPVSSFKATPGKVILISGKTRQITVTATYPDGSTQDISSLITYESADPAVATVSSTGLITGVSKGTTNITITFEGQTFIFSVEVKK